MNYLSTLSEIAHWMFITSLKSVIVIAFVMILRLIFQERLTARWQYALWFLFVLQLVFPFNLTSPFSVYNLVQDEYSGPLPEAFFPTADIVEMMPETELPVETVPRLVESQVNRIDEVQSAEQTDKIVSISFHQVAALIWFVVVVLFFLYALVINVQMVYRYRHAKITLNTRLLFILEQCKKILGVEKEIAVYTIPGGGSPFWFGCVHPRIYFPSALIHSLSDENLRHVFLHELAHFKRRDVLFAFIPTLLQTLHWFNPFVWFAFWQMRNDRETACDEIVLNVIGENNSEAYGMTLISLMKSAKRDYILPVMVGLADSRENLKRRIKMIANFSKKSKWWLLVMWPVLCIVAMATLTNAEPRHKLENTVWKYMITEDNYAPRPILVRFGDIKGETIDVEMYTSHRYDTESIIKYTGTFVGSDSIVFQKEYIMLPMSYGNFEKDQVNYTARVDGNEMYLYAHTNYKAPNSIPLARIQNDEIFKSMKIIREIAASTLDIQNQIRSQTKRGFSDFYKLQEPAKAELAALFRQYIMAYYSRLDDIEDDKVQFVIKDYAFKIAGTLWYEYKLEQDAQVLRGEIASIAEGEDGYYRRQRWAHIMANPKGEYDPEAGNQFIQRMFESNLSVYDWNHFLNELCHNEMSRTDDWDEQWSAKIDEVVNKFPETPHVKELGRLKLQRERALQYNQDLFSPPLTLYTLAGEKKTVQDFNGKYILLDFWATWCAPCREDHQDLLKLAEHYKNADFSIISICIEDADKVQEYLKHVPLSWPQLTVEADKIAERGISSYPTYILLDPLGVIKYKKIGGGNGCEDLKVELAKHIQG